MLKDNFLAKWRDSNVSIAWFLLDELSTALCTVLNSAYLIYRF
ncbi:conserved hypothetical protein [Bordetella avium 197N]|uniref:Uncharacterized protein n=1 Tax=Bordetella avium (strain 197N) TaxID=360910 RepID=Q2KTH5_BORA1|nr:conserved hypothetical protein [Bordetella avium 197N]